MCLIRPRGRLHPEAVRPRGQRLVIEALGQRAAVKPVERPRATFGSGNDFPLAQGAEVGVDREIVKNALLARKGAEHVLPFRYVAAARAAPQFEPYTVGAASL